MKVLNKLVIVICLTVSSTLLASYPSIEGLFRNSNNKDVQGNFSVLRLEIKEEKNNEASSEIVKEISDKPRTPDYIKYIFSTETNKAPKLLQIQYNHKKMMSNAIKRVAFFPNVSEVITSDENFDRGLFYSVLLMFGLNDSKVISDILKKEDVTFKKNTELMNQDKIALLEDYKKYLIEIKENTESKDELESPLSPSNVDKLKEVKEILKSSMYKRSENLRLIRQNGKFYWKLELEKISALFDNDTHRILELDITSEEMSVKLKFANYMLLNGINEMPSDISYVTSRGKNFKIKILKYQNFENKGKKIEERAQRYKDLEQKIVKKEVTTEISTAVETQQDIVY